MPVIISHSRKWLIYTVILFLVFATLLTISEFIHEKKFRVSTLNEKLNTYAVLTDHFLKRADSNHIDTAGFIHSLIAGKSLRITLINMKGSVLYDSERQDVRGMENHLNRPEVQEAIIHGMGTAVRTSRTTGEKYYYYARRFDNTVIRISAVYDKDPRRFIQPGRIIMVVVVLLLLITSILFIIVNERFGKSINTLRDFISKALNNRPIDNNLVFPENELGNIGQEIIEIYRNLSKTRDELVAEKAKLIRHLNMLEEGIAIFSKEKHVITVNNNFIKFINYVSDTRVFTADEFFRIADFSPIIHFIDKYISDQHIDLEDIQPTYEISVSKGGKHFSIKSIVFRDRSFEVSVHDISRPTKRRILKQQITENIAHELKTPVSSIKGFLETMINGNIEKDKSVEYLQRAYAQSMRLSDLIHDISLLTKIEEAGGLYQIEQVNLPVVVHDVLGELQHRLDEKHMHTDVLLPDMLMINGNAGLLYSVFRNLFDNCIDHAGEGLTIRLEHYLTDSSFYYFSFSDNGKGVPEEDLPRLFERFYRVDKGRDRKKGGTGLGLAIVKNAIQFHKGEISVKNRTNGGLEFLFTLARDARSSGE